MKKLFSVAMAVLLAALNVSCLAETGSELLCPPHTDTEVDAVFAAPDIQPFTEADGDQEMLDSIWVYYTDGAGRQGDSVQHGHLSVHRRRGFHL